MVNSSEIYKITFLNKGKVYEVFVKQVYQSDLYGFVEVEDYVFDEKKQVVVDPTEEKLKSEFSGVKLWRDPRYGGVAGCAALV